MDYFIRVSLSLAVCVLLASPSLAAKKIRWKMAMTWSSTLTPLATQGPRLTKMVSDVTGGNFVIKF